MGVEMSTMELVELRDRETWEIDIPAVFRLENSKKIAIALDNDEACEMVQKGYRVFGDENGPYLIASIPTKLWVWNVVDRRHVDVTIIPRAWKCHDLSGVKSYVLKVGHAAGS